MKGMTFKILFYAKRSRAAQNGEVPIGLRVTINGQRCEISISVKIHPDLWSNVAGRATGKDRKSLEVNNRLDTIRLRLMEIYREMEFNKEEINAKVIIDKYLGRETKTKITLLSIFQEHNDRCRKLRSIDMAPATVTRYETSYKHTAEFIKFFYKKDDVTLDEVTHQFIKDYEFYLKTERKCSHNTTTNCQHQILA